MFFSQIRNKNVYCLHGSKHAEALAISTWLPCTRRRTSICAAKDRDEMSVSTAAVETDPNALFIYTLAQICVMHFHFPDFTYRVLYSSAVYIWCRLNKVTCPFRIVHARHSSWQKHAAIYKDVCALRNSKQFRSAIRVPNPENLGNLRKNINEEHFLHFCFFSSLSSNGK